MAKKSDSAKIRSYFGSIVIEFYSNELLQEQEASEIAARINKLLVLAGIEVIHNRDAIIGPSGIFHCLVWLERPDKGIAPADVEAAISHLGKPLGALRVLKEVL